MKTGNGQKTVLQGLMKLMVESIEAFSASGRMKGKVKDGKEALAKVLSGVPDKTELCEMAKIEDAATKTDAALAELKNNELELEKLNAAAQDKRKAFDARLAATIGDITTKAGKEVSKDWGFLVQKNFVLGLVGVNAFRYVDPRTKDSLRSVAEAYMRGYNALGKTIVYGVNPRSVQELDAEIVTALANAAAGMDADKVQELRIAQAELRKHCAHLLKMKVQKPDAMRQSQAVQHKQANLQAGRVAQSGSRVENTSATMGQTMGAAPLPKPKGPKFTAPRKGGDQK